MGSYEWRRCGDTEREQLFQGIFFCRKELNGAAEAVGQEESSIDW